MTTFNFPKRVDHKRAEAGYAHPHTDEFKQYWGTFTVRWLDYETARGRKLVERVDQRKAALAKIGRDTEECNIISFIENYMVDWELSDEITGGKKVPFSVDEAIRFFTQDRNATDKLIMILMAEAADITNFGYVKDIEGNALAEPAKNS